MTRASDITPALLAELRAECGRSLICYLPSEIMRSLLDAAEHGFWRDFSTGSPNEGQAVNLIIDYGAIHRAAWTEELRACMTIRYWMPIPAPPPEPAPPPPIDWGERART